MAFTIVRTKQNAGSVRMETLEITADSASESIPVAMSKILSVALGPASLTTVVGLKINASGSNVTVSGATSGDKLFVTVFGV